MKSKRTWNKPPQPNSINHDRFVAELYERFPAIRDEIDPEIEGGLLHLEMGAFLHFTLDQIRAKRREEVVRSFDFLKRLLLGGDNPVLNAVHVSFLEHLPHDDESMQWAWELMSPQLREAWIAIWEYMDQLIGTDVAPQIRALFKSKRSPGRRASATKQR